MAYRKPWVPPDGGYGWVIVGTCFTLNALCVGAIATFGVLFTEFTEAFHISKTEAYVLNMCQFITYSVSGFFIGPLIKLYGCQPLAIVLIFLGSAGYFASYFAYDYHILYITYGLIQGAPYLGILIIAGVSTQQYFTKKRGLAAGITGAGIGVGYLVWPLVARFAIDTYSWKGAMLLMSAILLHGLPCALLLRPIPRNHQNQKQQKKQTNFKADNKNVLATVWRHLLKSLDLSVLKNKPFFILNIGMYLYIMGHLVPYAFLPVRAMGNNIGKQEAAILLSTIGMASIFGRPAVGFIGDRVRRNRVAVMGICFFITGFVTAFSYFIRTHIMFTLYAVLYGIFSSGYNTLQFPVNADLIGIEKIASVTGLQYGILSSAAVMYAPVVGYLIDEYDVNVPFAVFGCLQMVGGIVVMVAWLVQRCCSQQEQHQHITTVIIESETHVLNGTSKHCVEPDELQYNGNSKHCINSELHNGTI